MNAWDVTVWGKPPVVVVEVPELHVSGGLGLRTVQATKYARQEMGVETGVKFTVFDESGYFGEFFYGEGGWAWVL